jgi:Mor family transcriptional regulator
MTEELPLKVYMDMRFDVLEKKLDQLDKDNRVLLESKATLEGKANQSSFYLSIGISIVAMLIATIRLFIK